MRVSKEQTARNRDRVVETGARLFREHGLDGIGIADLMRASGLTHGGFYGQFESKEALAAECIARSFVSSVARWQRIVENAPDAPIRALAEDYLSLRHLNAIEHGCAFTALAPDAARRGGPIAVEMAAGMQALADILRQALPDGNRAKALALLSQMSGAMTLARSVNDPALAQEILEAARASVIAQGEGSA
ncbi:MAG: TetR/AcrR family transcriptional regulator [Sphingobium sp.]|nr:MAG: TetR/AcrR family transcriptional regulator [Sphingobium sp.]